MSDGFVVCPKFTCLKLFKQRNFQGPDVLVAAEKGKVGAVRHFLRVHPESLDSTDGDGSSLRTESSLQLKCEKIR